MIMLKVSSLVRAWSVSESYEYAQDEQSGATMKD